MALMQVPEVNSSWQDSFIRQFTSADIAVAVATGKTKPTKNLEREREMCVVYACVWYMRENYNQLNISPTHLSLLYLKQNLA